MRFTFVVLAALLALAAQTAAADELGTISGSGSSEIKKMPEVLRLRVDVLARGKDLKEALEKLKERRTLVEKQLATLGCAKESIKFDDPQMSSDKSSQQMQMERMIAMRMQQPGAAKKKNEKPPVVVGYLLQAEWPLKAANVEELLLVADALQEKIRAADLSGQKEMEKLSPKDEEEAEEAQSEMAQFQDPSQPKPGEPSFLFVAKIPEGEQAKSLREAFGKASMEAATVAAAAGMKLGALKQLTRVMNTVQAQSGRQNWYAQVYGYPGASEEQEGTTNANEAIATTAGKVTWRVHVNASFAAQGR